MKTFLKNLTLVTFGLLALVLSACQNGMTPEQQFQTATQDLIQRQAGHQRMVLGGGYSRRGFNQLTLGNQMIRGLDYSWTPAYSGYSYNFQPYGQSAFANSPVAEVNDIVGLHNYFIQQLQNAPQQQLQSILRTGIAMMVRAGAQIAMNGNTLMAPSTGLLDNYNQQSLAGLMSYRMANPTNVYGWNTQNSNTTQNNTFNSVFSYGFPASY